jgi:hypothetical protein
MTSAQSFFHKIANSNRRKKCVDSLLIAGTISTNLQVHCSLSKGVLGVRNLLMFNLTLLMKMALVQWALEKGSVEIWPLKEHFLHVYGIACANDALVAAHLELSGGSTQLNMSFVRAAHD